MSSFLTQLCRSKEETGGGWWCEGVVSKQDSKVTFKLWFCPFRDSLGVRVAVRLRRPLYAKWEVGGERAHWSTGNQGQVKTVRAPLSSHLFDQRRFSSQSVGHSEFCVGSTCTRHVVRCEGILVGTLVGEGRGSSLEYVIE